MDGRTRYNKISTLLKPIVGKTVHMDKLWRRIMIEIGSSRNVIREIFQSMIDLGLIVETKANYYKIISEKADI